MSQHPLPVTFADSKQARDLFRLAIEPRFLAEASALVVCTDKQGFGVAHSHVVHCDPTEGPSRLAELLDSVVDRVEHVVGEPVGGLALGVTRPGDEQVQDFDRAWFRAMHRTCHRRQLVPYGVYVVCRAGVRAVHIDDAA